MEVKKLETVGFRPVWSRVGSNPIGSSGVTVGLFPSGSEVTSIRRVSEEDQMPDFEFLVISRSGWKSSP